VVRQTLHAIEELAPRGYAAIVDECWSIRMLCAVQRVDEMGLEALSDKQASELEHRPGAERAQDTRPDDRKSVVEQAHLLGWPM
jgi:hypothetical protein